MNRELSNMRSSTYQHTLNVDEASGTYDYDCSLFVGYALGRAFPSGWNALVAATKARPQAADIETFFASIPIGGSTAGFARVARPIDLVPGDVVAWLEPADISGNTGHTFFVHGTPSVNPSNGGEILVPIEDATSSPHGATDSRWPSNTGLGTGTVGLLIDGNGAPIGYRWTGGVSTKLEYTSIAMAHVQ
jgi:hypothetical protein